MDTDLIREYIARSGDYYLMTLADAEHMEITDDGFCTLIRPKDGEEGGTSIFNFRFDGMSDEETEQRVRQIKERNVHTYWGHLPKRVSSIIARYYPSSDVNDEDAEVGMALLPQDRPDYLQQEGSVNAKKVESQKEFQVWASIANDVLHGGYRIIHPINHYHLCESGKMKCYLGYYDAIPVSTSAILDNNSIASLEFVATLSNYRRKGCARAVCAMAVDSAFNAGASIITLRAFGKARVLYGSLGFQIY